MLTKLKFALLVSGSLLIAAPANAADSGFYLGAGVGQMNTNVKDVFGSGYTFDESATGFKVFGGYKFLSWLGVEGAYIDGGSPAINEDDGAGTSGKLGIDIKSLVAAAVFALPVGDRFELFIKPGFAYWDAKTSINLVTPDFSEQYAETDSGSAFFIGGGAGFEATDNLWIRLEYEYFEVAPEYDDYSGEFVTEYDASAGFFSASFVYSF